MPNNTNKGGVSRNHESIIFEALEKGIRGLSYDRNISEIKFDVFFTFHAVFFTDFEIFKF